MLEALQRDTTGECGAGVAAREGRDDMLDVETAALHLTDDPTGDLTVALARERPRVVRFCAHLTGDWDAAEDLAQETLAQAWRSRVKLHDLDGISSWLNAIARNVSLRWLRAQARDLRYLSREATVGETEESEGSEGGGIAALTADDDELSTALERGELTQLLERALALLPAEMRSLLIETYVRERPPHELAARQGLGPGTLRARLHRGRLALRRVLATELRAEARAAGILPEETARWQTTRIWCPFCGRHPLETALDRASGEYSFRCAGDCQPGTMLVHGGHDLELLNTLRSPKAILARHCLDNFTGYRTALTDVLAGRENICPKCGIPVAVRRPLPDGSGGDAITPLFVHGIYFACPTCGPMAHASPWHLTLQAPLALRFWRRHPRMHALPTRELDFAGRPAILTGFASHESAARVEIVSARDTYEVLGAFGETGDAGETDEIDPGAASESTGGYA